MMPTTKAHPIREGRVSLLRVAIVGAGLAGLACAYELERLGVLPVIFGQQGAVGKPSLAVETMAQFMHYHPGQDIFEHIRQDLGLPLNPHSAVRRMLLHSPGQEASLHGALGYTAIRGHDERSLERQLLGHLAAEVHHHQKPDLWELRRQFDWVVVANGTHEWTEAITRWTPHITWSIRGAVVTGLFSPTELHLFLNPRYAGTGYCMISPVDERRAVAGVAVPGGHREEAERYWAVFRQEQGHFWQREEQVTRADRLQIGQPASHIVGNVILVGHAGGFVEPLGMTGQCPTLSSGVYAARHIMLNDRSFERFVRHFRSYYNRVWRLRRNINGWTDREMDQLALAIRYGGGLPSKLPVSILPLAGWAADRLHVADDWPPEIGLH